MSNSTLACCGRGRRDRKKETKRIFLAIGLEPTALGKPLLQERQDDLQNPGASQGSTDPTTQGQSYPGACGGQGTYFPGVLLASCILANIAHIQNLKNFSGRLNFDLLSK